MNQMPRSCPSRNMMYDTKKTSRPCNMPGRDHCSSCPSSARSDAMESMTCSQLLQHINEVSFAFDDILLYLDTHPCDEQAMSYAREMMTHRKNAMAIYARKFGPLTIDYTNDRSSNTWDWVMQPWPWEPQPQKKGGRR